MKVLTIERGDKTFTNQLAGIMKVAYGTNGACKQYSADTRPSTMDLTGTGFYIDQDLDQVGYTFIPGSG